MKVNYRRYEEEQRQKESKEILDKYIEQKVRENCEAWLKTADCVMLYTLHNQKDGYGAKRCRDFYLEFVKNYKELHDRYSCHEDGSEFLVIQKRLKDSGIDIDALQKEAEELYPISFV